jgi:hypothetical protein
MKHNGGDFTKQKRQLLSEIHEVLSGMQLFFTTKSMFRGENHQICPVATNTSYFSSILYFYGKLGGEGNDDVLCAGYRVGSWITNTTLLLLFLHACQKTKGMVISN